MAMSEREQLDAARGLFEAWSSGDADAPRRWFTDDVVMRDIVGHAEALRGWPAVRAFWEGSAATLKVLPEEYFSGESGVALTWMAYAQLQDDRMGANTAGKWFAGEGMSRLEFRDGKVALEVDYWHGPQGVVDDWQAHWRGRRAMSREQRGAVPGVAPAVRA